jgi:methylase of polypeptide subunit release factors
VADFRRAFGPDKLLAQYSYLFSYDLKDYPILDLACGDGHNGIFLASKGFSVVLIDRSEEALSQARVNAQAAGITGITSLVVKSFIMILGSASTNIFRFNRVTINFGE